MNYTIKQMAELTNVSSQTLRYYDKIGLLSPAYYAENGYRHYNTEQLQLLKQILHFRNLGLKLDVIKELLDSDDWRRLVSLNLQKIKIASLLSHYETSLKNIDGPIGELKSDLENSVEEPSRDYSGDWVLESKVFARKFMGDAADDFIDEMIEVEKKASLSVDDKIQRIEKVSELCSSFEKIISEGKSPCSDEAQNLISLYYRERVSKARELSRDEFKQFLKMQASYPRGKKYFAQVHKDFADFFVQSGVYFADHNLAA